MSTYQFMDHAEWMESNNAAANRLNAKRRGWKVQPETLTPFQKKVCDILGMVGGGIYNAPIAHDKIDWDYGWGGVSVVWKHHDLSTFDYNQLTSLVFLCHEARIRCSVAPAGPKLLRLSFWQREPDGSMAKRHPNLDEAVAAFRGYLPPEHRIVFRSETPQAEDAVDPHVSAEGATDTGTLATRV
jgi:hypothetical protein